MEPGHGPLAPVITRFQMRVGKRSPVNAMPATIGAMKWKLTFFINPRYSDSVSVPKDAFVIQPDKCVMSPPLGGHPDARS